MKLIVGVAIEIFGSISINEATVVFAEMCDRADINFLRVVSLEALQEDGTHYPQTEESNGD
jgi:hypothetical protein